MDTAQQSPFARLHARATRLPTPMAPEQRRPYYVSLVGGVVGAAIHSLWLVLFALYHVTPLAHVNIISVATFITIVVLVRLTGRSTLGTLMATTEVIVHQALAVYYLGWDYGFQYYLFSISGFAFMLISRQRVVPILCIVASLATLGWLYFHGQHLHLPHLSMPEAARVVIYLTNIFGAGLLVALFSYVYTRTAERIERELAQQYRELRETQLKLVQSEKMAAVGKLVAGLTHEINTPIGAVLSNANTGTRAVARIRQRVSDDEKNARLLDTLGQTLESTTDAARRLDEMVEQLQRLVRIDEAEVKAADLHEGLESALALLRNQLQAGPIEVVLRFDPALPRVLCRPAEINQALMHLLQNAIDAIDGPGTVTVTTSQDPERVIVAVQDTGRGLSPQEREGLFELGFSAGRSRVKLGMGLPISHQIVTRHGGELRVESTPGQGSTFTVVLPKQLADRGGDEP